MAFSITNHRTCNAISFIITFISRYISFPQFSQLKKSIQ
nr:MAG TPA_asm: hypothetical protein [Caudoviricetes sp.]